MVAVAAEVVKVAVIADVAEAVVLVAVEIIVAAVAVMLELLLCNDNKQNTVKHVYLVPKIHRIFLMRPSVIRPFSYSLTKGLILSPDICIAYISIVLCIKPATV